MQAKIISGMNGNDIESQLNEFLKDNPNIKVEHVSQSEACAMQHFVQPLWRG